MRRRDAAGSSACRGVLAVARRPRGGLTSSATEHRAAHRHRAASDSHRSRRGPAAHQPGRRRSRHGSSPRFDSPRSRRRLPPDRPSGPRRAQSCPRAADRLGRVASAGPRDLRAYHAGPRPARRCPCAYRRAPSPDIDGPRVQPRLGCDPPWSTALAVGPDHAPLCEVVAEQSSSARRRPPRPDAGTRRPRVGRGRAGDVGRPDGLGLHHDHATARRPRRRRRRAAPGTGSGRAGGSCGERQWPAGSRTGARAHRHRRRRRGVAVGERVPVRPAPRRAARAADPDPGRDAARHVLGRPRVGAVARAAWSTTAGRSTASAAPTSWSARSGGTTLSWRRGGAWSASPARTSASPGRCPTVSLHSCPRASRPISDPAETSRDLPRRHPRVGDAEPPPSSLPVPARVRPSENVTSPRQRHKELPFSRRSDVLGGGAAEGQHARGRWSARGRRAGA